MSLNPQAPSPSPQPPIPSHHRMPVVAGNWKMNTTIPEAAALVDAMLDELPFIAGVEKVLCPPFISLATVRDRVAGTGILVGAQNAYWEPRGAYTGEVSAAMLQGLADYVILGHSERRQHFHETDEDVGRKVRAALAAGLRVILCVGENLAENEAGYTQAFVEAQVRADLAVGLTPSPSTGEEPALSLSKGQAGGAGTADPWDRLVIAYEPIWAIGTGRAATPEGAGGVVGHIRGAVRSMAGEVADRLRILYGGSVTPENFGGFIGHPEIDGALVGGASLSAVSFLAIVRAAATTADVS